VPPTATPRAKRALHEMSTPSAAPANRTRAFRGGVSAKYSKAVESLTANWEVWFFLRLSRRALEASTYHHVIESPFATVRLRERATRGAVQIQGLLMAFKLLDMVQLRWRHLDARTYCRWFVPG